MITITIEDTSELSWLYSNDQWKDYVCEDFDENVVLLGNRNNQEYAEAKWWIDAKDLISDLDQYYEDDIRDLFKDEFDEDTINRILDAYNKTDYSDNIDFVIEIIQIMHPSLEIETSTIRGSSQSDWRDVVYVANKVNIRTLEQYYWGLLVELHIETDDDTDRWEVLTEDEFWEMERGDLKKGLRAMFDIPSDEEIVVKRVNGYITTPTYEEI